MDKYLRIFERIIVVALLIMMMIAVLFSALELAFMLIKQLMEPPFLLLNITKMLEIFGFFLMVLIGLELLDTISSYLQHNKLHVEVVILVAMIAISRKVIILDLKYISPGILYGIAAIILALSAGYFFIKRTLYMYDDGEIDEHNE